MEKTKKKTTEQSNVRKDNEHDKSRRMNTMMSE